MLRKRAWLLGIILAGSVLICFQRVVNSWYTYRMNSGVPELLISQKTKTGWEDQKTILLWTRFFEDDWFSFGETRHFDSCPMYNNCLMTRSRDLIEEWNFDAIIFHANQLDRDDIPKYRSTSQKYVFVNLESPKNRRLDSYFENFFNTTMTYRFDSDISWPYYVVKSKDTDKVVAPMHGVKWIEPSDDPLRLKLNLIFDKKTKMAAWLVSNCKTYGGREFLVQSIEKEIQVDRIGKCAENEIPQCVKSSAQCFVEVIEPHYFFYLSFENTLCQDYVTEKFFNALSYDVIPVVYGGANYSSFAPPHSYIDALDFDSPKLLADFLKDLSQNREEYLKYFWWKRFYSVGSSASWTLCNLCESINTVKPPKSYSHVSDWFAKDKCPIQNFLDGHTYATKEIRSRALRAGLWAKFSPWSVWWG